MLATQCLALPRPKVRRIEVTGKLSAGVYAKDVILAIIRQLGVHGGVGYAYEYAGPVIEAMTLEERLTVCNMSIEGGARCGYVNPDEATIAYLAGRPFAPQGADFERAAETWRAFASDPDCAPSPIASRSRAERLAPSVTWGINPGQSVGVDEKLPKPALDKSGQRASLEEAYAFMGLTPGEPIAGTKIDVAFIGSCTNGRISDLREAARVARTGPRRAARAGAGGAGLAGRGAAGREGGARRSLPQRGLRVARGRLLDVPGDEPRQAGRAARCARRPRTATSRAGRDRPPGARC